MSFKSQPARKSHSVDENVFHDYIDFLNEMRTLHQIDLDQAIKIGEILELKRRNNLYLSNGDIFDEHMEGFAEIFEEVKMAVVEISEK